MNDDAVLLRRYAEEKSETAFAELVRRHLDLVYSTALRRLGGDAHRAADVAQQVFTTLARDAEKLSRHGVLTAWLYTATRNASIDAIRQDRRRRTREQEAHAMHTAVAPSSDADWEKLRPVLDEVMDELPDPDRTAVLLRFFAQRPFAEIGTALHLSEDAARMRVERALEKMRAALAKHGVVSTQAALGLALANQSGVAAPAALAATITGAALAGAKVALVGAGAAGTLVGAGIFMSKSFVIVSVVALAAIGFAVYERGVAREVQTSFAAIARERDGLRAELRAVREQAGFAMPRSAPAPTAKATGATNATGSAAGAWKIGPEELAMARDKMQAAKERVNSLLEERLQLLSVPENLRKAVLTEEKPFRALYRREGFSAEQIEQFRTLLGRSLRRRAELEAVPGSGGDALEDRLAAEFSVDVREVFGAPLAANVQRHQDLQPLRAIAERVATNLFYTHTPLTAVQAEQLVDALAATVTNGTGVIDPRRMNADVAAAAVQTQSILSAPQVAELRSVVDTEPWRARPRR
jgi:RNA polymerase sigma factor (sigma-70 family)